jgi:hypothetical protein
VRCSDNPNPCNNNMGCDLTVGLCRLSCNPNGGDPQCPSGTSCVQGTGGAPPVCHYEAPDGGVADGGGRDGAADAPAAYQPVRRHGMGAAVGQDGRIYLAGGMEGTVESKAFEAFSTVSMTWERLADLPAPRYQPVLALADPATLYLFGGTTWGQPVGEVLGFSVSAGGWQQRTTLATMTGQLRGVTATNGGVYLFGGWTGSMPTTTAVQAYFPGGSPQWVPGQSIPDPRVWYAVAAAGDRIFVLGGQNNGSDLDAVLVFNPGTNAWDPPAPGMGFARWGTCAATALNHGVPVVVVLGGNVSGGQPQKRTSVWRGGVWTFGQPMPVERVYCAAVGMSDGIVFVFGGQDQNGNDVRQVDAYNVDTGTWTTPWP